MTPDIRRSPPLFPDFVPPRCTVAASLVCLALILGPAPAAAQTPTQTPTAPATAGEILLEVKRYEVTGNSPLSESETATVLASHLGAHRNLGSLEAAAAALETAMRERGFSFHRVIVPAQKPANGVVRLEVLQFPLASVEVVGNSHFSAENIRRSVPGVVADTSPDVREISRELGLANEHPSKRLSIVLKESTKADALEAEIRVRDVAPTVAFVSLTGNSRDAYDVINKNTGYTRLTVGYQNTNLFDRDHALTATYTTSPDHLDRVEQYGAFYWIPLYGYATSLQLYYTSSDVNTGGIGLGATTFNVSGQGEFMGARLTHSLPRFGEMTHNVALAIDDRFFESNVGVAGIALGPTATRSRPLSVRYAARVDQPWGGFGGDVEYAGNLSGGSANTDAAYQATRAGAPRGWDAYRYGLDAAYTLGNWGLSARLRGQYSNDMLIPGEQFGLGGVASVRGLREREFTGDLGYAISLEAKGPAIVDTLRPVFFYDFGIARMRGATALPGTTVGKESVATLGAGVRWNYARKFDLSVDVAYVLDGITSQGTIPGSTVGDIKLMFTSLYRFW